MTKQLEYEIKLNTLLNEIKREALKHDNAELIEIENEFEMFLKCVRKGNLIDTKKHGLKIIGLMCNEIVERC